MGLTPATGPGAPGLEVTVTGRGTPVTVAAHGLGATVPETRPLLAAVPGTRVLYAARGHGRSPLPAAPLSYDLLAGDLDAVATSCGATRALGVSLGAGTLLALLARRPDRFARVVLFLPAVLDAHRTDDAVRRLEALAAALEAGDAAAVARHVLAEVPADLHGDPAVTAYVEARTGVLLTSPGVAAVLRDLPGQVPVADRSGLAGVTAPVLLVAQEGDPLHPAQVARELAGVLPRAELLVFERPGAVFRRDDRARLRTRIGEFLRED